MASKRIQRVNELLQREIAGSLYRLQFSEPLDLARITVTEVRCSPDLRKANVAVSVLHDHPDAPEPDHVIRVLNRSRKDIQATIAANVVLKFTPHLQFEVDHTQENANRVLEILDQLPPPADDPEEDHHGSAP